MRQEAKAEDKVDMLSDLTVVAVSSLIFISFLIGCYFMHNNINDIILLYFLCCFIFFLVLLFTTVIEYKAGRINDIKLYIAGGMLCSVLWIFLYFYITLEFFKNWMSEHILRYTYINTSISDDELKFAFHLHFVLTSKYLSKKTKRLILDDLKRNNRRIYLKFIRG